jgi:hypothetical protein
MREFKTYADAVVFMDGYIAERGWDRNAVYSWLVVDEDYEDGCVFTDKQLVSELDASWKLEMRTRVIDRYLDGPHRQLVASERRAIARHLALNWEGIDVNLNFALSLSVTEITSLPVR